TAILKLNKHPFPAKIDGVVEELFDYAAPEMNLPFKILFANRWLTNWLLLRQLSNAPASNAMVRTTVAPTIIEGGFQENVLPSQVSATINLRILPGETTASVKDYLEKVIDDNRVSISKIGDFTKNPSFVSPTNSFGFQTIQKTILEVFPGVVVAPSLVVAGTDSRHYKNVSKNIYRFLPVKLAKEDLGRIHGINERISVENYKQAIRFYKQLMVNSTK
ncbi:MAG TPA: M20/M25/M40 family metallo-hydrolase, partial [Saprospiraceae bacterium]|nr:M20/M25/M40 family metallo-hydrolase [Saprospiraceae bacterium]